MKISQPALLRIQFSGMDW